MWGQIIAGGASLFGAASSLKGVKKQKRINAMNADLIQQTSAEDQRRLENDIIDSES